MPPCIRKGPKIPEITSMIKSQWFVPDLVTFYSLFSSHPPLMKLGEDGIINNYMLSALT
jgi:hypothetical protein